MSAHSLMLASVKRDHGLAILTLSDGETLRMPRAMLKERPYRGGTPFDRDAFTAFLKERSYPFAMEKAVALLATRARTEKEICDALRKNAYPETTIARVMARLQEAGYIDDADFAGHWAASRAQKGLGSRRIRMELRQKGVDPETIDQTLSAIDENQLRQSARKAAEKAARGRDLTNPGERQKVLAALARRGYDFPLARRALQEVIDDSEDEP
ncbi:MAG: regulatory protein RecX [Clostridia bacterium]|nr:regulatory protein RecX [Clostridia bacterium]